jgi:hypothetical protein
MKYKAIVYRSYELEMEYDSEEAPEMIGAEGKAEFLSRSRDISEWKLLDVSVDVYEVIQ